MLEIIQTMCKQITINRCVFFTLLSLLCIFQAYSNNLFSPFNRYELSSHTLQITNNRFRDSLHSSWFSTEERVPRNKYLVSLERKDQQLIFDCNSFIGYEYHAASNRFAGISLLSKYQSPFLNAYVSADVYSTENRINSPVTDIRYERFIKEDISEPITGMFDFRMNLPEAYLRIHYKFLSLLIGKQKLRWGPGYKGTLGLSGVAYSPFYFYTSEIL